MNIAAALRRHYAENGLPANAADAATWTCRLGPVVLRLPNWKWRREAILRHDLHHLVTGYPCTMAGEMQMAAWEFAAGRYRHWAASLFCGPLALAGLALAPRRTVAAFCDGRRRRSLYGADLDLDAPLAALHEMTARDAEI